VKIVYFLIQQVGDINFTSKNDTFKL